MLFSHMSSPFHGTFYRQFLNSCEPIFGGGALSVWRICEIQIWRAYIWRGHLFKIRQTRLINPEPGRLTNQRSKSRKLCLFGRHPLWIPLWMGVWWPSRLSILGCPSQPWARQAKQTFFGNLDPWFLSRPGSGFISRVCQILTLAVAIRENAQLS